MTKEKKEEIETLLISAGYEEDLKDIFFIEDFDFTPEELEIDLGDLEW